MPRNPTTKSGVVQDLEASSNVQEVDDSPSNQHSDPVIENQTQEQDQSQLMKCCNVPFSPIRGNFFKVHIYNGFLFKFNQPRAQRGLQKASDQEEAQQQDPDLLGPIRTRISRVRWVSLTRDSNLVFFLLQAPSVAGQNQEMPCTRPLLMDPSSA